MDPAERRFEDDDTPRKKIIKGAAAGLAVGTLCGTILVPWHGIPLIRTFKMMGNCGLTFGAVSGIHIGFQLVLEKYLMKRDWVKGPVEACVVGATVGTCVMGVATVEAFVAGVSRGKSIPRALVAGYALAFTWAFVDAGGQTTRIDNGK